MTKVSDLHKQWLNDPEYQKEYDALAAEFELAEMFINTRQSLGISQQEIAKRMNTKQSVVARLESAQGNPTVKTLNRYAQALGGQLQIRIAPR